MSNEKQSLGVVDQFATAFAFKASKRLGAILGFILGGVVPVATYLEAHCDLDLSRPLHTQLAAYLVLGGLIFSAKTVFAWARLAFQDGPKALGFVVLLEGVMITSRVPVLPLVLLGLLVGINAIATGCILAQGRAKPEPKAKAQPRAEAAPKAKRAPTSRKRRVSGVELKSAA